MAWRKRIARDIIELNESGFKVTNENGGEIDLENFLTTVKGPDDTPYEKRSWNLRFTIPERYPFESPSVGFVQKIFHPNVDESSGSICLDALNKNWSPTFTIRYLVETVIPYLLTYPNPDDPLNREAGHLLKTNKKAFDEKAKMHASKHAFLTTST